MTKWAMVKLTKDGYREIAERDSSGNEVWRCVGCGAVSIKPICDGCKALIRS